jgi:mRNA interferase HigB
MKLIGKQILNNFKEQHSDAKSQIESWEKEVEEAQWGSPADLKARYPKASLLKDRHVVFNICWNKYRLLVQVAYKTKIVLIIKIGTHKEYDNWNIG